MRRGVYQKPAPMQTVYPPDCKKYLTKRPKKRIGDEKKRSAAGNRIARAAAES
jgi:hypothetical protein